MSGDFGHFNFDAGFQDERGLAANRETDPGLSLMFEFEEQGHYLIGMPRQFGDIPVRVQIFQTDPGSPDPDCGDVVELSIIAGPRPRLLGWGGQTPHPLPLSDGAAYRCRYLVRDGDVPADAPYADGMSALPESYCMQFWEAPMAPAQILRHTSLHHKPF